MSTAVIDVTEATFEQEVVERSRTTAVVVDFWAEWCGPCRQLTPLLEKLAQESGGEVVLAKVDTDAEQSLAQKFQIQGIPAVKAFRDGEVVDEFVGAQNPAVVQRFFAKLVPSEADRLAAGDDEADLRRALELEPGRADVSVKLARRLHADGDRAGALELLGRVRDSFAADGLAARIRLEEVEDPALTEALRAIEAGDRETGLNGLIAAIATHPDRRDHLRAAVVGVLDELGPADPLARDARRRLAAALY